MTKFELSDNQQITINIIILVSNFLSLLGSLVITILYLVYKDLQRYYFKLVILLTIPTIIHCLNFAIFLIFDDREQQKSTLCMISGFIWNASQLSAVIWTSIISFVLHQTVINNRKDINKYHKCFLFVGYVVPLLVSFIPVYYDSYGRSLKLYCWIDNKDKQQQLIQQMTIFYGPLWIILLFNTFCCMKIVFYIRSLNMGGDNDSDSQIRQKNAIVKKLYIYPIILFVCWIWGTILRIEDFFSSIDFFIVILHAFFSQIFGFLNAISYFFNIEVIQLVKKKCFEWFQYKIGNQYDSSNSMVLGDDFIEKPSVKSSLNSSHIESEIRSISV